jgi:seryl-tRNA synthetase
VVQADEQAEPPRQQGRPRKWATEAERAKAYRDRRAVEHASVDELRRERRSLQRQLGRAVAASDRAQRAADAATRRADELAAALAKAGAERDQARAQITELRGLLVSARTERDQALGRPTGPLPQTPALSRQQRRALERNQRRR